PGLARRSRPTGPMRLSEVHTDEREPFPPPAPRRRWVLVLLGAVLAVLLTGSVAAVWLERQLHPPGGPGPVVTVTIEPGTSGAGIARLLEKRGVVTNPAVFRAYFRLAGDGTIPAGVYTFRHHDHLSRVVTVLRGGGRSELSKLTLPEGLTLLQIGDRVGQLPGRSTDRFVQEARNGSVRSEYEPAGSNQLEG